MADVDVTYDPITVNSGPVTVAVEGLDQVKLDARLAVEDLETRLSLATPEPLKSELKAGLTSDAKLTLAVPEPVRTESTAAIDLQPVVLDQCLRLSLGPLPPTQVRLPNRQRLAVRLFGVEVLSLCLDGEAQLLIDNLPRRPHVAPLGQHGSGPRLRPDHPAPAAEAANGLRVRLTE